MGCGSSVPAVQTPPENIAAPKKDARPEDVGTIAINASATEAADKSAPSDLKVKPSGPTQVRDSNNKTRVRRLSYVSNDPNISLKLAQQGADPGPDGQEGAEQSQDPGVTSSATPAGEAQAPVAGGVHCTMACMSRAGREPGFKKQNQDNCFAFEKYVVGDQSLFGAFDGHGPNGHLVSGFVKQHIPIMLVNHLGTEPDVGSALQKSFVEVDKALGSSRIDCEFSGSTAVVSFLKGKTLTTAWVGDSRGVLARANKKSGYLANALTTDHKPLLPEEKSRIESSNGRVERLVDEGGQPIGPYRVWLKYAWIPGLAMSRALGDALAHQVGVSSEPEVTVRELTPEDAFMILASDGVWEFIDNQEAVDIVGQYETVEEGCRQLVDEAYQRWLVEEEGVVDDITAVVVKFHHD